MNSLLCMLRNNSFKNFHHENLKCLEIQIWSQTSRSSKLCEGRVGLADTAFSEQ